MKHAPKCSSFRALPLALAVAAISSQSFAEKKGAEEVLTVVGSATDTVVIPEDLENYQATDLADVFRKIPSISVGGSLGIAQKIYVRGLEDSKINVTVDGAPQTSTLFHHIGRVTIDPDLLQEVEVQAGAGEATSGAGAIGGAIRFKTKEVNDVLDSDDKFGGKLKVNAFSNTDGFQYSANLYGRITESLGGIAYFKAVDNDNMQDGEGNEIFGTAAEQQMAFLKVGGEISDGQSLSLSYEMRDEEAEFSARPNWVVFEDDLLYVSEAKRDTFTANYGFKKGDFIGLEATAYSTESSFRGGRFDWLAEISTYGFDVRNTSDVGINSFTFGLEYRKDQVDSGYADPQPEEDHGEEGSVTGVYAQAHSQLMESLLLSYGLRYDNYQFEQKILLDDYYGDEILAEPAEFDDSEVSVNVGLAYEFVDDLTFGLGYAEAARGKEIGDGFTIDSYLYRDGGVVASDLKLEKVANIEASLEYEIEDLEVSFAVYQSEIDDAIFARSATYENIGKVKTDGFEFDVTYQFDQIELYLGYSKTDTELQPANGVYLVDYDSVPLNGYEYSGLGNSRGDTWNLGFSYEPISNLEFGFLLTHVQDLTIETLHEDLDLEYVDELYDLEKPSYTVVDVFADWEINDSFELNLAVTNLFDEQYRDHSSVGDYSGVPGYGIVVGPWEAGRDIKLSAAFSF